MFGGLVMLKELDFKVDVVQGHFTQGGNFILGALFCELLRTKLHEHATSFSDS